MLNPATLTIGFARRFATYKRATLLLSEPSGCGRCCNDAERPVQFVFAGKAHPADTPGKELIQRIEQFARQADVRHRFVFLADYDISIARAMYHGCDVWLNTPRRPHEACGTTRDEGGAQRRAQLQHPRRLVGGVLRPAHGGNGWAIESAEDDPDQDRRDLREAASLFGILENQVVPRFYDRGRRRRPARSGWRWCCRPWATLGPEVTAARMVRDYTTAPLRAGCRLSDQAVDGRRQGRRRAGGVARARRGGVGRGVDHVRRRRRRVTAGRRPP